MSPAYWDKRYQAADTPWDLGTASRPLVQFFETLTDKQLRILIPGGGPGHELAWLWAHGFEAAYQLDYAPSIRAQALATYPEVPESRFLVGDFFAHSGQYDLIVEQTFFAALDPSLRPAYAEQMARLLVPGGRLAGVLFEFPLTEKGPPFGGHRTAYYTLLAPHFDRICLGTCHTSVPERLGKEVWLEAVR
ncbi:MAG: methyltransferase domain-containing protein [Bacteroidia bacterium]|nr:methyltransferase domain-containing protein [Bacteroidia bacterium]